MEYNSLQPVFMFVCVCMSLCLWTYLQNYASKLHQMFMHVTFICGPPLTLLQYVNAFPIFDRVMMHIMARNRRRKKVVYSK